jgi:asparagine synthase (glutamine-hydrolysing)
MSRAVAHRGPDDAGIYWNPDKSLGLAHRRLSIIDLSALGHQPMWDTSQQVVMVFNGEIYNYRELRRELLDAGYTFNSHSDTEVLLNLYLQEGEKMLTRLNGIFSFALWDTRTDTLFLARDGLGVKPLYYAEIHQGFIFASELKALLAEPALDRTLNPRAVLYHCLYLWCPAPYTMLESVHKLEPGHALLVQRGQVTRRWQFYDLPYDQEIEPLGETEAVAQVRSYLRQAVQRQMVADVPVGAFLSGGLDSSAVVALAREFCPDQKLQCFTMGFQKNAAWREDWVDDLPYAQRVAKHLGVDLHVIDVGPQMVELLGKMIYHLDEPQADLAALHTFFISQLAREHGIKVLLSGAGGDDIFTGYRRHFALQSEKYWSWLPPSARRVWGRTAGLLPSTNPLGRRLAKAWQYAGLEGNERIASYFYWIAPEILEGLWGPALKGKLASRSPAEPLLQSLAALRPDTPALNRLLYLEGKFFLTDHNLNYTDKMSMAAGVEVRVPLLDPDLVALACRLPLKFKQHGRTGKWIFKKAMEPFLLQETIYRPKTGFVAPLRYWLRHELRPLVEEVLSESSLRDRGLFDPAAVSRLIDLDRRRQIDASYTIFALICIELWCRIFLEGKYMS